jgi:hypothetical protein
VAYNAKKTEHAGPKKHRGAYAGRKQYAKRESGKERRRADAMAIAEDLCEPISVPAIVEEDAQ